MYYKKESTNLTPCNKTDVIIGICGHGKRNLTTLAHLFPKVDSDLPKPNLFELNKTLNQNTKLTENDNTKQER